MTSSIRMIMLQFADENQIGWKGNIEFCELYDSSLIHYENHEKFEFLSSKAQSLGKVHRDYQLINTIAQNDLIFIGEDQCILVLKIMVLKGHIKEIL